MGTSTVNLFKRNGHSLIEIKGGDGVGRAEASAYNKFNRNSQLEGRTMKKDSLKSVFRVMLVLVLSLLCVLSSVTAVLSAIPQPEILSPTEGQTIYIPSTTIPIKVKYDASYGDLRFEFQCNANSSWMPKAVSVNVESYSGGVAEATAVIDLIGTWRFHAAINSPNAPWSDWRVFQIRELVMPPIGLKAKALNMHEIALTWVMHGNQGKGYKIERKKTGEQYKEIKTLGPQATDYRDSGLSPDTTYFYRVRSFTLDVELSPHYSSYSSEVQATTLSMTIKPSTPPPGTVQQKKPPINK